MNALQKLFSESNLIASWRELKSNFSKHTCPGIDGVSRERFARNIEAEAGAISADIGSRKFRFERLRPIAIPKGGDKIRLINVPTLRDRFVQRVLLKFLVSHYGPRWKLPNSFSSMRGEDEGVHATLHRIARAVDYNAYVIKADLSAYFDNIDRTILKKRIAALVRHRSLLPLLYAVIDSETSNRTPEYKALFLTCGLRRNVGIRQGMPISPVLAYLFLMDVDRAMDAKFFRYVDDLLFIGDSRAEVEAQFNRYRKAVEARGITVHELDHPKDQPKTKLYGPRENFEFLGVTVVRREGGNRFLIPSSSKVRIEKQIAATATLNLADEKQQNGWVVTTSMKASNLVQNYKSAYHICDDWPSFERALKDLQLNMCRRIARQLSHIERQGDREMLLRVFGI